MRHYPTFTRRKLVLIVVAGITVAAGSRSPAQTDPTGGLARVGGIVLNSNERSLYTAVVDPVHGYAYFATLHPDPNALIVKVALGNGDSPPYRVGALTLPNNIDCFSSAIDVVNGYAYFGANGSPSNILKVALGAGDNPPTLVGILTLNSGESGLLGCDIDPANGYGYFGVTPGVVKIALGVGNALPTRIGIGAPEAVNARRLLIDAQNGYGYALLIGDPAEVVKFSLGTGSTLPSTVGTLTVPVATGSAFTIDTVNGYGYSASYAADPLNYINPGQLAKFALGAGNSPPTLVGEIDLPERFFSNAVINPAQGYLLLCNDLTYPASNVVIIGLGTGDALPTRLGAIQLMAGTVPWDPSTVPVGVNSSYGEIYIQSAGIDTINGYAYFGMDLYPGTVVKVSITAPSPSALDLFGLPAALAAPAPAARVN